VKENESDLPIFPEDERYGAPIARPSKIVCIGLNFDDHAAESGMDIPEEPVLFFKASSAFCGPNDDLVLPRGGDKTDWEVELAFVVGKRASYVDEKDAMDHLAGYALHNDYSERAFQLERSGQWVKGKSCDTFAPFGPFLATPDEIEDVNNLKMWLKVNGETMQSSNSSNLHYKIPFLLSYVSQFMTLLPGDIISTGTPPGVGLGIDPPVYLKAGDLVELGIDQLGSSAQKVVASK
jgi:2-keto-4-pentenoate hydratase/2-oxohepta-3-ene-1,7-dioic acid hydratase in catechol pathway